MIKIITAEIVVLHTLAHRSDTRFVYDRSSQQLSFRLEGDFPEDRRGYITQFLSHIFILLFLRTNKISHKEFLFAGN